jgi:dynein heavy chain
MTAYAISLPSVLFLQELEQMAAEQSEDAKVQMPATAIKPLHKIISEHKDVVKIVIQLSSIINTFKVDVNEILDEFTCYQELWKEVSIHSL